MRFYEIKAEALKENPVESMSEVNEKAMEEGLKYSERRTARDYAADVSLKTERFNQKYDGAAVIFASGIRKKQITLGALTTEEEFRREDAAAFLAAIEYPADTATIEMNEILLSEIYDLLRTASRSGYHEDEDEVMEKFGIQQLFRSGFRGHEFAENMITEEKEAALYQKAEEYLSEETLLPEIARILTPSPRKRVKGHPVHYLVETDNLEIRKNLCRTLLSALHRAGRVRNLRYSYTDIDPAENLNPSFLHDLYRSASGGSLIMRITCSAEAEESSYASGAQVTIETICEQLTAFRNDVLTIICMPRECEKLRRIFYENLGGMGIIEIKEDFADREKAEKYLRFLAKKSGVRTDRKLFSLLKEGRTYLSPELAEIFGTWYDDKLKTTYYPQYKEVATSRKKAAAEKKKGNAYRDLSEMAGLSEAKDVINKAIDYYKAQKLFKTMGMKEDHPAMHMVFTGNPGSAKTTVARLFADIMKDNGLLSKGTLVEVGRGDLVGKYVGWTAPTVKKYFERAKGGVLFIDEAYSLVDDKDGMYGDEAINTIVQEMENHRDDLVVIFAGYPDKMEAFLNKNPGLRSRIAFHVPFSDYSAEELCEIAKYMGKEKGVHFTEEALSKLSAIFEEARKCPDFGNGRYVRNMLEKSRMNQASRLLQKNVDEITREDLSVIEAIDIETPALSGKKEERTIGFMC